MESFYGGRSGAAFVIVQRFDGIDIPQPGDGSGVTNYTYTENEYATQPVTQPDGTTKMEFILTTNAAGGNIEIDGANDVYLIEKNSENYKNYTWTRQANNGDRINNTSYSFPEILARGMIQCFRKGTKRASEVNYGEYVLIDTMLNMHCQNNPDNGKVFRRGMDVLSPLAGAEYIGQIVGPKGDSPEVDILHYEDVIKRNPHSQKTYNPIDGDIVPGSYVIGSTRFYEDDIKYVYATVKDAHGNVKGCEIGFRLPTLVQDFEANSINPYTKREAGTSGFDSKYTNLIYEDPTQYQNDQWQHPFFQKWQIDIPQGYHGMNPEDIEVIHTYTMTPEYKENLKEGILGEIEIFNDPECTSVYKIIDKDSSVKTYRIYGTEYEYIDNSKSHYADFDKIYGKWYMQNGADYDADPAVISVMIKIDDSIKYVKKEDCYMDILRYREVDFDNTQEGIKRYFYIGDYNTVQRVSIADDGTLTVFYSTKPQPKDLEQVLRWIDTQNTDGITIDEDGTVHVYYNTVHEPDEDDPYEKLDAQGRAHDHQDYKNVLDWVTEITLSKEGKFTILYNNDTVKVGEDISGNPIYGNKYETTLQWIDYVDFTDDGTIKFYWNTDNPRINPDTAVPAYILPNKIKFLHDVQVENTKVDPADSRIDGYEGTGDQKIHIQYNNDGHIDRPIGAPLNYIIETVVSTPSSSFPNAPYNHLLVYYADPELRLTLKDKWVTYPSTKVIDGEILDPSDPSGTAKIPIYHIWKEWVDLGNVRGSAGGIHIIKNVTSLNDLKDPATGKYIPPEKLTDASGTIINPDGAGWACSMGATDSGIAKDKISYDDKTESMDIADPGAAKDILFYDYETEQWYSIGSIDSSSVDPSYIIAKTNADAAQNPVNPADLSHLKDNGFWLATEKAVYAF